MRIFSNNKRLQHISAEINSGALSGLFGTSVSPFIIPMTISVFVAVLVFLFMPWTQNVKGDGVVTNLRPEQRPQEVNAMIAGTVQKWYVKDGDKVKAGDTILQLAEIKADYLDPELISRTDDQIQAKEMASESYEQKIAAIDQQWKALTSGRDAKSEQLRNKILQAENYVQSDSAALTAAKNYRNIAAEQYQRQQEMYKQGLKSLTELESKQQSLQDAEAKLVSAGNKLQNARNDLQNARLELQSMLRDYDDKLAKLSSEKYTTMATIMGTSAEISKMLNQRSNYNLRAAFYVVRAPQDGQVTNMLKSGIGAAVKEGEVLANIVPDVHEMSVEMYVGPTDIALLHPGNTMLLTMVSRQMESTEF
jgi:membrane fusion protein, adhesin transport system